jgi:hypothetical protein
MKRPKVVEAWMTHRRTPFLTERLVDGRIRKIARDQVFAESLAQELARLREVYGKRWTGIHGVAASLK